MWPFKNKEIEDLKQQISVLNSSKDNYKEMLKNQFDAINDMSKSIAVIDNLLIDLNSKIKTTHKNSDSDLEDAREICLQLLEKNKTFKETCHKQDQIITQQKDEIQTLHYEIFKLKGSNEIALKKLKFELEEQKFKDFTDMFQATIESNKATNVLLVEKIVDKLKEVQQIQQIQVISANKPVLTTNSANNSDVTVKAGSGYNAI